MACSVGVESFGSGLKIRVRGYFSSELSLVVGPYRRAPKRAKQLSMVSMATIPLFLEFFRCRVDVLQSSTEGHSVCACAGYSGTTES